MFVYLYQCCSWIIYCYIDSDKYSVYANIKWIWWDRKVLASVPYMHFRRFKNIFTRLPVIVVHVVIFWFPLLAVSMFTFVLCLFYWFYYNHHILIVALAAIPSQKNIYSCQNISTGSRKLESASVVRIVRPRLRGVLVVVILSSRLDKCVVIYWMRCKYLGSSIWLGIIWFRFALLGRFLVVFQSSSTADCQWFR
jgi:hypothetical protein